MQITKLIYESKLDPYEISKIVEILNQLHSLSIDELSYEYNRWTTSYQKSKNNLMMNNFNFQNLYDFNQKMIIENKNNYERKKMNFCRYMIDELNYLIQLKMNRML